MYVLSKKLIYTPLLIGVVAMCLSSACSTQKNTAVTRAYHSVNTRYNVHFNAQEAYNEALKSKIEGQHDNLSEQLYIYPVAEKEELDNYIEQSAKEEAKTDREDIETENKKDKPRRSPSLSARREMAASPRRARQEDSRSSSSNGSNKEEYQPTSGSFGITIDKTTKAIRQHSIKVKPKRDPSRRNDKEYQDWLGLKEFNPFLRNTWLLLGKAELQNGDYLQAAATFSYISKIYSTDLEMVAECRLWTARTYSEMGWYYEAENMLRKVDRGGGITDKHKGLYSAVYANLYTRTGRYKEAIPYLEVAVDKEKNKYQRQRMQYILGQAYTLTGDYQKAYAAYGRIPGLNTPYELEFNARLRQMELPGLGTQAKMRDELKKMTKRSKNKEYLDQIYTAIGNNYLQQGDTAIALENYKLAIKQSTRKGYDLAMAQIALADIYFRRHMFIGAQPYYADALPQLTKKNKDYERVSFRSAVLDELVVHAKVVHEQDSLQHVAQLPEAERLQLINEKIVNLKKQEEDKLKEAERQRRMEEREVNSPTDWNSLSDGSLFEERKTNVPKAQGGGFGINANKGQFYFYDTQTVAQGKIAFQKQWGTRKLEDDWRRRRKAVSLFGDNDYLAQNEEKEETDTTSKAGSQNADSANKDRGDIEKDIYTVEYYLQQLPFTDEAVKQSNVLIENGLYNLGLIYKDKLEDYPLAIDAFDTDMRRFPNTPNLEDIYYQMFLMYMQTDNRTMMAYYRQKLIDEFAGRPIATALSDPDYEWNLKNMALRQEQLYTDTYDAYVAGDTSTVRTNYKSISTKFPFSDLMPQFMMLDALTYAQSRDAVTLENRLKSLVEAYPKSDVTPLATDMLKHIIDGQILLSDGTPVAGNFDWSKAYLSQADSLASADKAFSADAQSGFTLLFVFAKGSTDRNQLLFDIANYNFSNYLVKTYDLGFDEAGTTDILQVRGFESFDEIKTYINRAFDRKMIATIDPAVTIVPVATDNYLLFLARGLQPYTRFFEEEYGQQVPRLIAYWKHDYTIEGTSGNMLAQQPPAGKDKSETKIGDDVKPQQPVVKQPRQMEKDDKHQLPPVDQPKPNSEDEIDLREVLSEDQMNVVETVNAIADNAEEIMSNPVDGLKNVIKDLRNRPKLTKEEKAEEKRRKRSEKEERKRLQAIAKVREDSVARVEKAIQDSISTVEKLRADSIKAVEQQRKGEELRIEREKKEARDAALKARDDEQKRRDDERKAKIRQQKERQKQRNDERKERERLQDERRRQREKELREKEKAREGERKAQERGRKR